MNSRRYCRHWVVVGVVPAVLGCYTYAPLDTSTEVQAGERISVEVTDRGRAELGERLGSGVVRLEGTLTRTDSQDLVMNVWRVMSIGGEMSRWSGESVRFRRDFAARVQTRTLNRPRTYLVAGAAVAGLVVFAKSFDLLGSFVGGSDPGEGPPPASSRGCWP
jgi:hypothetical protein